MLPRIPLTAILAGGRSRRMGSDKASLLLGGLTLLERVFTRVAPVSDRVVVVGGVPRLGRFGVPTVPDRFLQADTLGGIATALGYAEETLGPRGAVLCVAADMPFLSPDLLRFLNGLLDDWDLVVPRVEAGYEPLCAVYRVTCLSPFADAIRAGNLRVRDAFAGLRTREVREAELREHDPDLRSFLNLNRPEDLEAARRLVEGTGS